MMQPRERQEPEAPATGETGAGGTCHGGDRSRRHLPRERQEPEAPATGETGAGGTCHGVMDHFTGLRCQFLMLMPRLGVRAVKLMVLRPSVSLTRTGLEVSQEPLV